VQTGNYLALHTNFTSAVQWSTPDTIAFAAGTPIHIYDNVGKDGSIWGKAYQVHVKDSTGHDFYLSNYLLRYYQATRPKR